VLFDEPTTGQDPIRKNLILSMIAQYRRKFGFTAVLISHDIPDVFFVSDRVVLLWEGTVGFEGTYEEAIRLRHPMIAEFLTSLQDLQEELTGLLSKDPFRSCYPSIFTEGPLAPITSAILFTIELDFPGDVSAADTPLAVMEALGEYTARHFAPLGGFSARYTQGEMLTVLPHTSADEAEQLMVNYAQELERETLANIESISAREHPGGLGFEVRISGGVSEVSFRDDIERIVRKTKARQQVVATFKRDNEDQAS
jgi:phospholipid/cholesterol/gamma-HCH transport system ATP-binding protein